MNFIFQGSQKMHVRVAISQKGLVNFFRYAHQIKAFFIPVQKPVSLFMGRFFPLKFHSALLPSSSSNNSDILPPQSSADLVGVVGRGNVNGGTCRLSEKMLIGTGQKVRGSR